MIFSNLFGLTEPYLQTNITRQKTVKLILSLKPMATSKNACEIYLIDIGTIFVIKKEQSGVSPRDLPKQTVMLTRRN